MLIYAREEKTRKPVLLDHRKVKKIRLIDVVRAQMAEKERLKELEEKEKS